MKISAFSAPPELHTLLRSEAESRGVTISRVICEAVADRYGTSAGPGKPPQFKGVDIPEGVVMA